MSIFNKRRDYFELEQSLETISNFEEKVKTVQIISQYAAKELGLTDSEAEAYARAHIANIVRENEVLNMLRRIENDLFDKNIDIELEEIVAKSARQLAELGVILKNS